MTIRTGLRPRVTKTEFARSVPRASLGEAPAPVAPVPAQCAVFAKRRKA
ncbi:MAG: hypothetical protein LBM98_11090 [Oscillospiraceae bacterium]|nr:hypothetical protein [Oscillospiraceae bacterium]